MYGCLINTYYYTPIFNCVGNILSDLSSELCNVFSWKET